jgi:hypothetical protein
MSFCLQLVGSIEFNDFQNKVRLPTKEVLAGQRATVIGWGITSFPDIEHANILQKASMTILDNAECSENHPFEITEDELCAFHGKGIGTCGVSIP